MYKHIYVHTDILTHICAHVTMNTHMYVGTHTHRRSCVRMRAHTTSLQEYPTKIRTGYH